MNPIAAIVTFSLAILLISGCRQATTRKQSKPKPFLSLVSSHQNHQLIINRLIEDLSGSYEKDQLLTKKLNTLINRKLRKKVFFPLFQQLSNPLRKVMVKQYLQFRPLDLPDNFQGFLMAYEGPHFSDLLQLYLVSDNPKGLEAIEQRLHILSIKEGNKFRISHARVLFRLGRLGEAFYKVEASIEEFKQKTSKKNFKPFSKFADLKHFNEEERGTILELCEMSGSIALLQGNGILASKRLTLLFHHPNYRGLVLKDLISALLQQNMQHKALDVLGMASLEDFEDPEIHLLRAKVLLYSDHHRAAKKHWLIARSLGATGSLYEEVSFLISHYYDREVSLGEQGVFAKLSENTRMQESLLSLDFYHMRLFVLQYEKLRRHDPKTLKLLKQRYLEIDSFDRS